ncbi:RNA polymerase sigma factor [Butyricimonas virosa]|uniref:Sigma-70 family RNA polymerase sigma factor n=2 Tax=Butyricimonas virosa TaxID=544645 RepID=A0ABX7H2U9_9BACT|nr:sigma-70 family RNA polymerase sigma factor [Butyricimonas virosa]MCI7163949.1 sigma-70 family RNA polymerase sigma factor [Butyricimonas virosa]MDY5011767.1 sigma-70 family RNA polymerase sigma factor [Butyricimonas virosa]QRO49164.1 sigma-70 family RNA polymerase sigma factor [Butyricimonas virosa]RGL84325.1 sigma-70 family RNA polymerase sigma factor [Butyricimonas virosa]UWO46441.1 sigma-70 family RNA polymerase sigma factor [Butyricimonas virosa]
MAIVSHKEFKAFFETFFIPVYTLIQRYTGERELSRDFTQEAFVRVFEHWGEFETEENAKAFLYTVARRIYLDHCKHQKIENQYQNRVNEEELEEYDFLKEVTQQEVSRILYDAVDKLPSQTRSIILLNLKGFNNTEVAERLGVSVNTIKSLKKSAYVTLRTLLSKDLLMILFVLVDK